MAPLLCCHAVSRTFEVPERQGSGRIDKQTGQVVYKESGRTYLDKNGREVQATTKIKLLDKTEDIRTLSSGTLVEDAYADYANKMKALANKARLEYVATPTLARSASAAKTYQPEVERLTSALRLAQLNAPREREAQRIANARVKAKIEANNITDKMRFPRFAELLSATLVLRLAQAVKELVSLSATVNGKRFKRVQLVKISFPE